MFRMALQSLFRHKMGQGVAGTTVSAIELVMGSVVYGCVTDRSGTLLQLLVYTCPFYLCVQVMAIETQQVSIPFQPLLEQIVDCLHLEKPVYGLVSPGGSSAYVAVGVGGVRPRYVFFGGECGSIDESREKVAYKAVQKLIKVFRVHVSDFTSEKVRMYTLCGKLYKSKIEKLTRQGQGLPCELRRTTVGKDSVGSDRKVSVDCVAFLAIVRTKTRAFVSPVESVWVEDCGFIGWVMVDPESRKMGTECI